MVSCMKTGKQYYLNFKIYAIIWANKIIAGVKGYSIDKAHEISPLFASMVQEQIDSYQKQVERLKYVAVVFSVFSELRDMFNDFYDLVKNDVNFLLNNNRETHGEVEFEAHFVGEPEEDLPPRMREALKFNSIWDDKFKYIMNKIGELSLAKINRLPSKYANLFKEQKQIVSYLVESIGNYNNMLLEAEWREMHLFEQDLNTYESMTSTADEYAALGEWVKDNTARYQEIQDENINMYHRNMIYLNNVKRSDFLDD